MSTHDTNSGTSVFWNQARSTTGDVVSALGHSASSVGRGISFAINRMQVSRMRSVLNNMSDSDLALIELDRKDIARHAEFLVNHKYEGL